MTSTLAHAPVAHQFDDLEQQRLSAKLGMWAFLVTEVLFFGGMFAGYAVYRGLYSHAWAAASRELDLVWGTVNTVVLLTSSLTMALAVDAIHRNDRAKLRNFLIATIFLAATFLGIKGYEYAHKWHEHLVPGHGFTWHGDASADPGAVELFFSFYFVMTGCHALHMIIGIGVLSVLALQAPKFSSESYSAVENTGLYWHFVDIVWVFLFPLLYLIDRAPLPTL